MIGECWIENNFEGSGHGLIMVLFQNLSGGTEENYNILFMRTSVPAMIEPSTSQMQVYNITIRTASLVHLPSKVCSLFGPLVF
jgi:hypothetical protein